MNCTGCQLPVKLQVPVSETSCQEVESVVIADRKGTLLPSDNMSQYCVARVLQQVGARPVKCFLLLRWDIIIFFSFTCLFASVL